MAIYIIANNEVKPPQYYTGAGFEFPMTTPIASLAQRFSMLDANAVLKDRQEERAKGWRVVPVRS